MTDRPCTCHPDDDPPKPCAKRYALTECREATEPPYPKLWHIIVMTMICLPILLAGMLWMFGSAVESLAQRSEEKDRCLRAATNGYEIRQCGR